MITTGRSLCHQRVVTAVGRTPYHQKVVATVGRMPCGQRVMVIAVLCFLLTFGLEGSVEDYCWRIGIGLMAMV